MRILKKYFRLGKKTLVLIVFAAAVYSVYSFQSPSIRHTAATPQLQKDDIPRVEVEPINQIHIKSILNNDSSVSKSLEDFIFEEEDLLDEFGKEYTIIIWGNGQGVPGYVANQQECAGNIKCHITYDKSLLKSAHAIVFKSDSISSSNQPGERLPHQHFVWWASESPLHTGYPPDIMDKTFNLTFHYRTDADVYAPYGSINLILRDLKAAGETELEPLLERKKRSGKMAAWAVSNCYGRRMDYAKSLMDAGLQVDTFGQCFDGRQLGAGRYSDAMYQQVSEYKFYLSFENSISCKDYFTEKFWFNGLRAGAVPIVWGPRKEDILKVAPTHSFIHTDDFSSPKELVEYLNFLVMNETAYAEYHQWRTWINHPKRIEERLRLENREYDLRSFCKLCSIVQADGRRRKRGLEPRKRVVPSLKEAWGGPERGRCHK